MIIKSTRHLPELIDVLQNPNATGNNEVYWVFSGLGHSQWENMTVTAPGNYGGEYPKTYGHYHASSNETEIYKLISGSGIFLLQKKHVENGVLIENKVEKVYLVGAEPGDEIKVPADYGHSWSNIGDTPLITFDNWKWGHTDADYLPIKNQKGMSYYITNVNGQLKVTPNPNYHALPDPIWVTAKDFAGKLSN